jgi:intracellular multiplication protein IcmJ
MLEIVPSHRSGVLIRLPEMSQVALNRLMPALYTLRLNQGTSADKARRLLTFFMGRRQGAVEQLTSDEPSFLAEKMSRCATAEELCELRAKVEDIRLLPLDRKVIKEGGLEFNQFPQILAYWRSKGGPLGNLRYDGQLPLLDSVLNGFGLWPPEESVMDEPPPPFR